MQNNQLSIGSMHIVVVVCHTFQTVCHVHWRVVAAATAGGSDSGGGGIRSPCDAFAGNR